MSRYRKAKPIWILLKQETVSDSGISCNICKSAPRSRQITTPEPHHSVFYRPDARPAAQPTASKHCPRDCLGIPNLPKYVTQYSTASGGVIKALTQTWYLGLYTPNGITIGSAVLVQLKLVTIHRQTDHTIKVTVVCI